MKDLEKRDAVAMAEGTLHWGPIMIVTVLNGTLTMKELLELLSRVPKHYVSRIETCSLGQFGRVGPSS